MQRSRTVAKYLMTVQVFWSHAMYEFISTVGIVQGASSLRLFRVRGAQRTFLNTLNYISIVRIVQGASSLGLFRVRGAQRTFLNTFSFGVYSACKQDIIIILYASSRIPPSQAMRLRSIHWLKIWYHLDLGGAILRVCVASVCVRRGSAGCSGGRHNTADDRQCTKINRHAQMLILFKF